MVPAVYILGALTSCLCALLLLRSYRKNHSMRLLLWSGLCFVGLTLDNIVLFLDVIVFPDINMALVRKWPALLGLMLLIYGLVWDAK